MRYVGQEHAVTVELPLELFEQQDRDGIKQRFDAVHETRYGYAAPNEKAEIVSLRSAVTGADAQAGDASASRSGGAERPRRRSAASGRSISPRPAASSTRRPIDRAAAARPATASQARR